MKFLFTKGLDGVQTTYWTGEWSWNVPCPVTGPSRAMSQPRCRLYYVIDSSATGKQSNCERQRS